METKWVRWVDARELSGWVDTAEAIEKCKAECLSIQSVGRIIYEDDDRLVLVSDFSDDGEHVNKQMIIPKSAIIGRGTMKTKKVATKRKRNKRRKASGNQRRKR